MVAGALREPYNSCVLAASQKTVLRSCFGGDVEEMLRAANYFLENGRPPRDLGKPYRAALGTRPRRPWWLRVREELASHVTRRETLVFDCDSVNQLSAAWNAVRRGHTIVLALDGTQFAQVVPLGAKYGQSKATEVQARARRARSRD